MVGRTLRNFLYKILIINKNKIFTRISSAWGGYRLVYDVTAFIHIVLIIYSGYFLLGEGTKYFPLSNTFISELTGSHFEERKLIDI